MVIYNKIAVCESSDLIFEGIKHLLNKLDYQLDIVRINDLNELMDIKETDSGFNLLIINPAYRQLNSRYLSRLQRKFPNIKTVAIISSLIDSNQLEFFSTQFNILDSEQHISNTICNLLSNIICDDEADEALSEREIEVLIQMVHGLSNKEIAAQLNISIHTVISHRKNITTKTGVKSQSGLAIYAISKNIVSMDDFQ